jgi:hypothetical protein
MNLIERLRNSFEVGVGPDDAYAAADEIERLREKLKVATEALDTAIMSLQTGYPEYDNNDTLEILSEALAKIREE